jgi:hypothetical protein
VPAGRRPDDPEPTASVVLVPVTVGGDADGLIQRVRPDLEAEHRLDVGAGLSSAPAGAPGGAVPYLNQPSSPASTATASSMSMPTESSGR